MVREIDCLLEKLRRIDSAIVGQRVYFLAYLHRAEALIAMGDFEKAKESYDVLVDLVENVKAHPDVKRSGRMFWSRWLRCIAENDAAEAIRLLELEESDLIDGDFEEKCDVLYTAAAIYSLASGRAQDAEFKQTMASRSIQFLQAIANQDLFCEGKQAALAIDPDFAPLRETEPYRDFLESIE